MMTSVQWYFVSVLAFCTTSPACALEISSNKPYYADKGSNVTLDCKNPHPSDNAKSVVQWKITSSKNDQILFIHKDRNNLDKKSRIHFTSLHPYNGDASISISDLRMSDAGTYQCHLMSGTEEIVKTMKLTVREKLSTPVCAVEGEPVGSNDVTLKCKSSQGTPPLMYSWTKTSGNQKKPPNAIEDATGGNLFVKRISGDNCGSYLCTVESLLLDTKHCEILLKCPSSSSNKSDATNFSEILLTCPESPPITSNGKKVIIAVAVTAVLLLAIVFVISFWYLRKNRGELVINETVTE
ncbi:coxsackievirus and adenovirus receptor homolog [Entelurus aequoreus]|uniref:coxsackievirus and adenovirus receptor homolog n=1 Tax=Entelurus aequoreus TaxID=161455 RepID=UPI002B1DC41B|nr:coxsackievirus and adenovirus receptor homolog [Entelurus aequoreus]XP_061888423.1 coxsackievirus and adenovirus receptor homolog [Entelurus aequoreus]XP_061888424.1 coxsackievirus and adenovirus receptor homolog [Entelurus aequoreus]